MTAAAAVALAKSGGVTPLGGYGGKLAARVWPQSATDLSGYSSPELERCAADMLLLVNP